MFGDDGGVGQGETLAGTSPYFLGAEKQFEDAVADGFWDAGACVRDADLYVFSRALGSNGDQALASDAIFRALADRVSCIDHEVENDLDQLIAVAHGLCTLADRDGNSAALKSATDAMGLQVGTYLLHAAIVAYCPWNLKGVN